MKLYVSAIYISKFFGRPRSPIVTRVLSPAHSSLLQNSIDFFQNHWLLWSSSQLGTYIYIYRSKGYWHTFIVIGMIKLSQKVLDSSIRQVPTYNDEPRTNHFLHSKISSIWPTIVTHLSINYMSCYNLHSKEMWKISQKLQTCAMQAGGSHWSGEVR